MNFWDFMALAVVVLSITGYYMYKRYLQFKARTGDFSLEQEIEE